MNYCSRNILNLAKIPSEKIIYRDHVTPAIGIGVLFKNMIILFLESIIFLCIDLTYFTFYLTLMGAVYLCQPIHRI